MKKTVWATGLFAAIAATGSWSESPETTTSSFEELVTETSETIEAQEQLARANATVDMNLVRLGLFECVYADNDTTSRDRVFIRGTDSCGFLDGNESFEDKTKRIAGYVNEFLPDVHQPESTRCHAVQSLAGNEYRNPHLKQYIELIDNIPLTQAERLSSPTFVNTQETIEEQFDGDLYFGKKPYKEHSCELLLFAQNQPFQANGAGRIRGGLQSMARGLGMIVRTGAGWTWSGIKTLAAPMPGAFVAASISISPWVNNATGKMLWGDFAPNVTQKAGGLVGAWYHPLTKLRDKHGRTARDENGREIPFTAGDGIITAASGLFTGYYFPVPQIMAAVGAVYTLTISRIGKSISKLGSASVIKGE